MHSKGSLRMLLLTLVRYIMPQIPAFFGCNFTLELLLAQAIKANSLAGEAWKRRGQARAALGESVEARIFSFVVEIMDLLFLIWFHFIRFVKFNIFSCVVSTFYQLFTWKYLENHKSLCYYYYYFCLTVITDTILSGLYIY